MLNVKSSMIHLPKLILASSSPRRAEILTSVGWDFEKQTTDLDESVLPGEQPRDYVQRLAEAKARATAEKIEGKIVLGADTTVVIENQIIGKPEDLDDARKMLKMLSGNWHEVFTGAALVCKKKSAEEDSESRTSDFKSIVDLQITRVKFAELAEAEIEFLVLEGKPLDKAGAYAVQAQAALFIEKIEGDYWNVVGLPVNLIYEMLRKFLSENAFAQRKTG